MACRTPARQRVGLKIVSFDTPEAQERFFLLDSTFKWLVVELSELESRESKV
jgi:hypothetical protein